MKVRTCMPGSPAVRTRRLQLTAVLSLLLAGGVAGSRAESDRTRSMAELTRMSLAELMEIPVTPLRVEEPLARSAAAVTVLTGEDIRRSGATSIPEALRMAPGLHVARVDAHTWAIGSRGFTDVFANKLLVMIDGRTVYTPLFSGVFWDVQDTLLEDIDRIEVIRGPGATMWGANAVNGVINIITRHAADSQGLLLSGGGGTFERAFGSMRYGMRVNEETHLRIYGKYFRREEFPLTRDHARLLGRKDARDGWEMGRGGLRLDWEPGAQDTFMLNTELYGGSLGQTFFMPGATPPYFVPFDDLSRVNGGHILGRWMRYVSPDSRVSFQAYFDWSRRDTVVFREERETGDLDFQHQFALGERHEIIWGLGYRGTQDRVRNSAMVALVPARRQDNLFSAFVQDQIAIVPERLQLALGSKFEHNDYTGFEVQPGARLLWTPWQRHHVWAAVSRAVRTPSRAESDIRLNPPGAPPGQATFFGNPHFDSETLIAYEVGYRVQPHDRLTLDLAGFFNDYDDLRSARFLAPPAQLQLANELRGETYGFELAGSIDVAEPWWRLHAGYTLLQMRLRGRPGAPSALTSSELQEGLSPQHQFFARSAMDLGPVHFDTMVRYVDRLPAFAIPSYVTVDTRVAWRFRENAELALVGRNLVHSRQLEFLPTSIPTQATEVPRSVYVKLTVEF